MTRDICTLPVLLLAIAANTGCDGVVESRVKVVGPDGSPVSNAILRFADGHLSDTGVHTDDTGCASLGRVVSPFGRDYRMVVERSGDKAAGFKVRTGERICEIAHLQPDASPTDSASQRVSEVSCPCDRNSGHEHTVSVRFKIRSAGRETLSGVEVLKTGEAHTPYMFLSSDDGCIGISWIVGLHNTSISLSLEKEGYQPFSVDAPTMLDQCFSVTLAPVSAATSSSGTQVPVDRCECAPFSGTHAWRDGG